MPIFRRTEDYLGEINLMVAGGAGLENIHQRLASEGLPEERIRWLIGKARRARWQARFSLAAKVAAAVAIIGLGSGIILPSPDGSWQLR